MRYGYLMTHQEQALKQARKQYGDSAYTEDTVNYRRIGFRSPNGRHITGIGDNWHDAFVSVARQVNHLQVKGKF
jgi:hypothetical protein